MAGTSRSSGYRDRVRRLDTMPSSPCSLGDAVAQHNITSDLQTRLCPRRPLIQYIPLTPLLRRELERLCGSVIGLASIFRTSRTLQHSHPERSKDRTVAQNRARTVLFSSSPMIPDPAIVHLSLTVLSVTVPLNIPL